MRKYMARYSEHVYEGSVQGGVFVLTADGKPETPPQGTSAWGWGDSPDDRVHATAIRIITREVPATSVHEWGRRFVPVLTSLARLKPWRITSRDIRHWMQKGKMPKK
jgi:hypothetical protein